MVKIIVERRLKEGGNPMHLLRDLRTAAMRYPGYVTGETLVNTEDKTVITVISTWRSIDDWQAWEASATRADIYKLIDPLLVEEPKVRIYHIAATEKIRG